MPCAWLSICIPSPSRCRALKPINRVETPSAVQALSVPGQAGRTASRRRRPACGLGGQPSTARAVHVLHVWHRQRRRQSLQ